MRSNEVGKVICGFLQHGQCVPEGKECGDVKLKKCHAIRDVVDFAEIKMKGRIR